MRFSLVLLLGLTVRVATINGYKSFPNDFTLGLERFVISPPEAARNLAKSTRSVTTKFFTQKLDNFDPSNTATWQQRYQINDGLYQPGGPIFVMLGGEWAIDIGWMTYGDWYNRAQTNKALMFQPEHRFYGKSRPTSVCDNSDLRNPTLRGVFYYTLFYVWQDVTQSNGKLGDVTVKSLCDIMSNVGNGDLPTRMYKAFTTRYGNICVEPDSSDRLALMKDDQWDGYACSSSVRQFTYQECTEIGGFRTTDSDNQPFGNAVTISLFENLYCKGVFGLDVPSAVDIGVAKTNANYGGKLLNKPNSTNIVLTNGSIDPLHPFGILESISDTVVACFITGTSHCADVFPAAADDLPELTHCRQVITDNIAKWLA